ILEYHASVQRIKDLSASDVPRAVNVLTRMIDALESYLRVAVPAGAVVLEGSATGASTTMANAIPAAEIDSVATTVLDEDEASARDLAQAGDLGASTPGAEAQAPDRETGALDLEPQSDGEAPDA